MNEGGRAPDALDEWLSGEGLAALDGITGHSQDVIGVVDRDLLTRYVSWTVPGLTRQGVIGKSVLDLVAPGHRDQARDAFLRVLRTGASEQFEMLYSDHNGMLVWVVRVGPIRHQGEVIGLITISTDVTEQRRADVDRDRFFSLSLDMLIVAAPDGQLKRINPALGEVLGYSVEELLAMRITDLIHPDDRESTRDVPAHVRAGTSLFDFENRSRRRDATYRMFSWRATVDPITGDIYAVARDITEERATEVQLRHAQKMEALGLLAGGVAHDFNNLMQAILANAHLALPGASPAVADHLHEIESAGRRAAELTRQLLLFSRRQALHRAFIDINVLLRDVMKLLRRLIPENIAIDLRDSQRLAPVNADRTQIEQVIINLCVNARDAMLGGGTLTIETGNSTLDAHDCDLHPWVKPGPFVRLSVTDTGEGISPELRERVFDPFFTTKDNHRGTGLGLATVYGIVQQHGGLVQLDTEVGRGATFKVYLPAEEDRTPINSTTPPPMDIAERTGETILVAEDEQMVSRPVILILERAGYKVIAVDNGAEAVRVVREQGDALDLALLDIVMPTLGGPQAWEQMQPLCPKLRVLFMSGYADEHYRRHLPPGAQVLDKPFGPDELLAAVRRTLATSSPS